MGIFRQTEDRSMYRIFLNLRLFCAAAAVVLECLCSKYSTFIHKHPPSQISIMGIASSAPKDPYAKLKDQVSLLGDHNPFGDDEILRLARCMTYLNAANDDKNYVFDRENMSNSWLVDLAVFCSTLLPADFSLHRENPYDNLLKVDPGLFRPTSPEMLEERTKIKHIMTIIEKHVLPKNFGQILQEKLFILLSPSTNMTDYDKDNLDDARTKIAWKRLEKFIDGASETSRRGSRKALICVFNCCSLQDDSSHANAKKLMDCFYRLSLACAIYTQYMTNQIQMQDQKERLESKERQRLAMQQERERMIESGELDENEEEEEEEEEEERIIHPFEPSTMYPEDIGNALTASVLEFAAKHSVPGMAGGVYMGMEPSQSHADAKTPSGSEDKNNISLELFLTWAEANAPCLSSCLETFMHLILFPDKPYPPSRSEFVFPKLRGQHSAFFEKDGSPLLFTFAAMSPSLGGAWHRLYTSDSDGLSFNRLQNSLLGYSGPTLIIIKEAETGGIFGASTTTAWKESKDFYGNSDCFLFGIQPTVKVMRPRGVGTNFMYCNSESRSRGYDGLAHGIGFGGDTTNPRLFISEAFDGCKAGASDLTFEGGRLLPPRELGNPSKIFDLESMEVWGVGGDSLVAGALGDRHKQREIVASNIRKARKVDKAQFLDDFQSGLIESKAFNHRGQMRGRADCRVDDKKNYVYE